jgi:hypothetical protein
MINSATQRTVHRRLKNTVSGTVASRALQLGRKFPKIKKILKVFVVIRTANTEQNEKACCLLLFI